MINFISSIYRELTLSDYVYSALIALFFTWLINNITKFFGVIKRPTEFGLRGKDINKVVQKCYALFPNEIIQFGGKTFKRGMNVRVTTISKKTFEGELIGLNSDNIFCVITKTFIAADILDNITEIVDISSD